MYNLLHLWKMQKKSNSLVFEVFHICKAIITNPKLFSEVFSLLVITYK